MLLLFTNTEGADESRAIRPGRTRAQGSAWGHSLLALAWERCCGGAMPELAAPPRGRPFFPARPDVHFSISHTGGAALCAFGTKEVGADIERPRPLSPGLAERILSPEEAAQFELPEVWTLRESYYKLSGKGGPCSPRFRREGGGVFCEDERACCILTRLLDCPAALCTWEPVGFETEEIPIKALLR